LQKKSKRLPTTEEFFEFLPKRLDFEWSKNKEGLVTIKVPKFTSKYGISFCKVIKKENIFSANLDKLGSLVWIQCNGKNTVKDILNTIQKEFPKEDNLNERLFLFLSQLKQLKYIDY
jgi:hypothetical protein